MFLYESAVTKARSLKEGDMVSWNSSGGRAEGKVVHVMDYGTLDIPNSRFKIKGEKDNPAVLIQLYRDGEETDIQVGHKMSSLTRKSQAVAKHGSHDQSSHGRKGGKGGSGMSGGGSAVPNSAPSSLTGDMNVDNAVNKLPKSTRDSAYRTGFMMGQSARNTSLADKNDTSANRLFDYANKWVKDTKNAINLDKTELDDKWLEETVRAVGVINGLLSSGD